MSGVPLPTPTTFHSDLVSFQTLSLLALPSPQQAGPAMSVVTGLQGRGSSSLTLQGWD